MSTQLEIERKWIPSYPELLLTDVKNNTSFDIMQGYLANGIRVRISKNAQCELTIKRSVTPVTTNEWNYEIPMNEALTLLATTKEIHKTRYDVTDGYTLDVFHGDLAGLMIIEKEFESEDAAANAVVPEWCGEEVTDMAQYKNTNLGGMVFIAGIGPVDPTNIVTGDNEEPPEEFSPF